MENLPNGIKEDYNNITYYDTEKNQFYLIRWTKKDGKDVANRHYIEVIMDKATQLLSFRLGE